MKKPNLKSVLFILLFLLLLLVSGVIVFVFSYPFMGAGGEQYRAEFNEMGVFKYMLIRLSVILFVFIFSGLILLLLNFIFKPKKIKIFVHILLVTILVAFIFSSIDFFSKLPTMK
ncbi:uncharacterized BrkB/YihY/UPF0761 family membrane protein [Pedobacter sp. UYP30]|uniref:hypothetical protein n=1 Tax=Pedobacter sp. UYP30 TaxID=1756400 RepID=UPI00339325E3